MKRSVAPTLLITQKDVEKIFKDNLASALMLVEQSFYKQWNKDVLFPDKISQIFDVESQNRINCMPATLISDKVCGMKWVSVFPNNPQVGIRNVTGMILLSEIECGLPLSVLDGTYITAIRTAAVGGAGC